MIISIKYLHNLIISVYNIKSQSINGNKYKEHSQYVTQGRIWMGGGQIIPVPSKRE